MTITEQAWGADVSDEFLEPFRIRHMTLVKLARFSPCDAAQTWWDDSTKHPCQIVTDRSSNDDSLGRLIIAEHINYN